MLWLMPGTLSHDAKLTSLSHSIRATLDEAYARGTVPGDGGKVLPTFPSGLSKEPGLALSRLVREERATTTIETGMALGLSTLWMLDGSCAVAGESGLTPQHTSIDPYQATDWRNAGRRLIESAGVETLVTHVAEDSTLALPRLVAAKAEGRPFDLMLVDGGHLYELAFCDIFFGSRLVRPGGLIIVDDVWMPAVTTAVHYFVSNSVLVHETRPELEATKRFAILRVPTARAQRAWDHFQPFDVVRAARNHA
jgi:predicted O-methyltransferase YrrM